MQIIGVEGDKVGIVLALAELQMIAANIGVSSKTAAYASVVKAPHYYGTPLFEKNDGEDSHYDLYCGLLDVLSKHHNAQR